MKDEVVSFETARLAKKIGFNWPCAHAYVDLTPLQDFTGEISEYVHPQNHNRIDHKYSAPTQSLLQRWLRDKYDIKVLMEYECITSDQYEWGYNILHEEGDGKIEGERLKSIESISFYPGGYVNDAFPANTSSYEEVLEEGLKTALKLIK